MPLWTLALSGAFSGCAELLWFCGRVSGNCMAVERILNKACEQLAEALL